MVQATQTQPLCVSPPTKKMQSSAMPHTVFDPVGWPPPWRHVDLSPGPSLGQPWTLLSTCWGCFSTRTTVSLYCTQKCGSDLINLKGNQLFLWFMTLTYVNCHTYDQQNDQQSRLKALIWNKKTKGSEWKFYFLRIPTQWVILFRLKNLLFTKNKFDFVITKLIRGNRL